MVTYESRYREGGLTCPFQQRPSRPTPDWGVRGGVQRVQLSRRDSFGVQVGEASRFDGE
jgi:hypothetical protein